jgi:nitroreductase
MGQGDNVLKDLIQKTRSYRRFYQDEAISLETLRELVDLARQSASAANRQPLKYMLVNDPAKNAIVFKHLAWAGYIEDWDGPVDGEQPTAYIVILCDTAISEDPSVDHGIAAQSMMLGATERGLGGCMIGSIRRVPFRRDLNIPEQYKILLVLALGKPREDVVMETAGADGDIKYWRDEAGVHHVPKRPLDDLIVS